jgi:hypothetical protein
MILDIEKPITISVTLHPSGALSIAGPVNDKRFALAMLEHAKDAVRGHHAPVKRLVIPAKDVVVT